MTPQELKELILQSKDLPVFSETIPEWGNITVYIRSMSAKERDEWQASYFLHTQSTGKKGKSTPSDRMANITASLLVKMLCADPEGKQRIFCDADVDALGEKSAVVLNRLQDKLREASGTTEKDEEAIIKNLEGQEEVSG